jgi:drug/metabolite transporter (DMT)-like permease
MRDALSRRSSIALLGLLAIFWGINWPILKIGVAEVSPWVFRTITSAGGACGLFAIALLAGYRLRVPIGQWRALSLCALLNITAWNILILYGVGLMDSGRAAILAYTMPLWASLTGVIVLREGLTARRSIALLMGLAAMAILFLADSPANGGLGAALVVVSAICWGAGTVAVKANEFAMPVVVTTAWQHTIGVIPIAIVAVIIDTPSLTDISTPALLSVLYNMTVTSVFCYWAYFRVVASMPVVVSTVGTLMVPVIGVFASAWAFDTTPALSDYVALLLVVASVFLVLTRPKQALITPENI